MNICPQQKRGEENLPESFFWRGRQYTQILKTSKTTQMEGERGEERRREEEVIWKTVLDDSFQG